jgi:hypothetical protein
MYKQVLVLQVHTMVVGYRVLVSTISLVDTSFIMGLGCPMLGGAYCALLLSLGVSTHSCCQVRPARVHRHLFCLRLGLFAFHANVPVKEK